MSVELLDLPDELLLVALTWAADARTLGSLARVCHRLASLASEDSLWEVACEHLLQLPSSQIRRPQSLTWLQVCRRCFGAPVVEFYSDSDMHQSILRTCVELDGSVFYGHGGIIKKADSRDATEDVAQREILTASFESVCVTASKLVACTLDPLQTMLLDPSDLSVVSTLDGVAVDKFGDDLLCVGNSELRLLKADGTTISCANAGPLRISPYVRGVEAGGCMYYGTADRLCAVDRELIVREVHSAYRLSSELVKVGDTLLMLADTDWPRGPLSIVDVNERPTDAVEVQLLGDGDLPADAIAWGLSVTMFGAVILVVAALESDEEPSPKRSRNRTPTAPRPMLLAAVTVRGTVLWTHRFWMEWDYFSEPILRTFDDDGSVFVCGDDCLYKCRFDV
eukprot:TRINITY_DN1144_c0_g4_i1.p1 TRINITY_DN1144_c0_g4~~TRINITY_DN1144_c0_g4_i1.p1  ORF type:complete len:395 (-),score=47.03 TRINITY_DN1144_c0_g4_i1:37-1221(-)